MAAAKAETADDVQLAPWFLVQRRDLVGHLVHDIENVQCTAVHPFAILGPGHPSNEAMQQAYADVLV